MQEYRKTCLYAHIALLHRQWTIALTGRAHCQRQVAFLSIPFIPISIFIEIQFIPFLAAGKKTPAQAAGRSKSAKSGNISFTVKVLYT